MLILALVGYAAAMLVANLTVAAFGSVVAPINAFLFIGLDLVLRDWLHIRLKWWQMGALIFGVSGLTYVLNPAAQTIAVASAVAFALAAVVDWGAFSRLTGSWVRRSVWSNVPASAVDTVVFINLAGFATFMSAHDLAMLVAAQFAAKVAGGALWAWLLSRRQAQTPTGDHP